MVNAPINIIFLEPNLSRSFPIIGALNAIVRTIGSNIRLALVVLKDKATITSAGINTVEAWIIPVPIIILLTSFTSLFFNNLIGIKGSWALVSTFHRIGSNITLEARKGQTYNDDKLAIKLLVFIWLIPMDSEVASNPKMIIPVQSKLYFSFFTLLGSI